MPKILKSDRPEGFIMHQDAKIEKSNQNDIHPEYDKYTKKKDLLIFEKAKTVSQNILNQMKNKEDNKKANKKELTTKRGEQEMNIEKIAEILKNNKIDQIIIAGEKIPDPVSIRKNPKSKEKTLSFTPDLDAKGTLYLFNKFSTKSPEETYNNNAICSIIEKNGDGFDLIEEKKISKKFENMKGLHLANYDNKADEKKIRVFVDVGGQWPSIKTEQDGKITNAYIDHHGPGKRDETSGVKMMMEVMEKAKILKDLPSWFKKFADFVTDIDNLSYLNKKDQNGRIIFDENYFRNEWPNSLYAIAEKKIPFETLIMLCEDGTITDLDRPFTKEELDGKIGQTKIGDSTIKELCQKQKEEVVENLEDGIKNSMSNNKKEGLNLEKTILGKVIYQNYFTKKNKKTNIIFDHLAFKATKAKQYDTYISWNKKGKSFYINSQHPKLEEVVRKLNEADPGCAKDIRGVMVYGKSTKLTEEEFLNIIDPNILKNSKLKKDKLEKLPELIEFGWTEEEAQKELNDILFEIEKDEIRLKEINDKLAELEKTNL